MNTSSGYSRLRNLRKALSDAGDRHDWDTCERIDSEIEALTKDLYDHTMETIRQQMRSITADQRLEILQEWCDHCGGPSPCHCWNYE